MVLLDMDMPNNCFVCWLNVYGNCLIADKGVPDYDEDESIVSRPDFCPLTEPKGE